MFFSTSASKSRLEDGQLLAISLCVWLTPIFPYSATKFITRFSCAERDAENAIAWLPLALVALALLAGKAGALLAPGAAAVDPRDIMVLGLRNYNAHHPWNAVSIIGLGLLFSLELLIAPDCLAQPASRRGRLVAAAACSLLFCVAWHALDNFNKREFNALHALVFENTPRHSLIVLADSLQPQGTTNMQEVALGLDRKEITAVEWESRRAEIEPKFRN